MRTLALVVLFALFSAPGIMAQPADCADGRIYDDGFFESGDGLNESNVGRGGFVQLVEAPSYPMQLKSVCICWIRTSSDSSLSFDLGIWSYGAAGPGTLLGIIPGLQAANVPTAASNGQFYRYDISSFNIVPTGPVVIGPIWRPRQDTDFFVCADRTSAPGKLRLEYISSSPADDINLPVGPVNTLTLTWALGIRPVFCPPPAQVVPPNPPAPLSASSPTPNQILLSWQDNSSNEDTFRVEQLIGGVFQEIGTTASNVTTAIISNLAPATTYSFRVRASNVAGPSAYSNTASATTQSGPAPLPPAGAWLTNTQLPGYQFKVRINGGALGTQVADCVPETLCVAGAIPTRAELFLRIIGPRANGFLWAQVIRFTTSRLETWVQRTSGGPIRYYDLPAVPLESEVLPGLVDKEAFQP